MIRAYDEYGNVVDLVEQEEWIRQDERKKCIAQIQFKWEEAMIKQIEADIEKYIRADERKKVLDEVISIINTRLVDGLGLRNATKYGNRTRKQQDSSYGTIMRYELADVTEDLIDDIEQMKGEQT